MCQTEAVGVNFFYLFHCFIVQTVQDSCRLWPIQLAPSNATNVGSFIGRRRRCESRLRLWRTLSRRGEVNDLSSPTLTNRRGDCPRRNRCGIYRASRMIAREQASWHNSTSTSAQWNAAERSCESITIVQPLWRQDGVDNR